jgi:hypothetical protein
VQRKVKWQYVICNGVLANERLEPSKLKGHLQTKHAELEYFERRKRDLSAHCLGNVTTVNGISPALSYILTYRVAKEKMDHTVAGNIIPICMDIVHVHCYDKRAEKLSLSNNTVCRRIYTVLISQLGYSLVSILQSN